MNSPDQQKMLQFVRQLCFALVDINLFLDTHPQNEKALAFYNKYQKMYREAMADYSHYYGPLVISNVDTEHGWSWVRDPWPWEGGC